MKFFSKNRSLAEAQDIAGRLPDILMQAENIAASLTAGPLGRKRKGQGDDFWQFRPYDPQSDSADRIDWRRSASQDKLFVREREDMRPHKAVIWLDPSTSLHYTSDKNHKTKFEYGFITACILTNLLTRGGQTVISTDSQVQVTHPQKLARLTDCWLDGDPLSDFNPGANTDVILISDFLKTDMADLARIKKQVRGYSRQLYTLIPIDRAELSYPFTGHLKFETVEDDYNLETQNAQAIKAQYLDALKKHHDKISGIVAEKHLTLMLTDRPLKDAGLDLVRLLSR